MAMNVGLTAEQKIALEALQRKSCDPINEQNIRFNLIFRRSEFSGWQPWPLCGSGQPEVRSGAEDTVLYTHF